MRKQINKLIKMMDEGSMDSKVVAEMCLGYMSEDDVEDMMLRYARRQRLDEDEDEEYADHRNADKIDGYDRDDLGESPDY